MTSFHQRRRFVTATASLAALFALPSVARPQAKESRRAHRTGIVIDGNLVPPLDDTAPFDEATARAVRSSGLTALKATIGGSTGDFARATADIDSYDKALRLNATVCMKIAQTKDFERAHRSGKVGIIYSFEGVDMLESRIDRIDHFFARGVRVMQLCYNRPSAFASGVLTPQPSTGLTPLGREAVARMNALGVSLDLSHCDEPSTLAALAASKRPGLITHAGCAAVHDHPRNKSDTVLRALAATGGVIGIYELSFLVPFPRQPVLADYSRHLRHALDVCGEDHVGIGSDALLMPFDTSPESMDEWNKDIQARKASGVGAPGEGPPPFVIGLNRPDRYAVIAEALADAGLAERLIDKVLGLNILRVFSDTWKPLRL